MNARTFVSATLAMTFALAASAAAQTSGSVNIAPAAEFGLTVAGQAVAPAAPAPVAKVTLPQLAGQSGFRGGVGSYGDDQTPPPPPPVPTAPTAGHSSGTAPQMPKVQMPSMGMPIRGQLANVKVEFTIADQIGTKPPTRKTMTLIVADRENGRIRTNSAYAVASGNSFRVDRAPLSVDVMPTIDGGKIRLDFTLEYELNSEKEAGLPADAPGLKTNVSERLSAILESGVPLVIAQSSEPLNDRKLTVEVKATLLK